MGALLQGDVLQAGWTGARARWPRVRLPLPAFQAFLRSLAGPKLEEKKLEELRLEELFLVAACLAGDDEAMARMDDEFLGEVDRALARSSEGRAFTDDVRQQVRRMLFAPEPGKPSKLTTYSGRGPLAGWVRAVAVRAASNLKRGTRREELDASQRLLSVPGLAASPELEVLKTRYRKTFEQALAGALAELPQRDRAVLRLNLLEGLNIDQIGTLYRVHRTTVARWISTAKRLLVDETRRRAKTALKLSTADLQSLMNLVRSDLDVSINRLLKEE